MYNLVLIKGNSNDLKEFDIYFKGAITRAFLSTLFTPAVYGVPHKLDLYLNELELPVVTSAIFPVLSKGCFCLLY